MPFKSEKQRRYLWANEPDVARKFASYHNEGGGIHINPANEGKFTKKASSAGMGVQEYAKKVLAAPEGQYDPSTRKQANFARNAAEWHNDGGTIGGRRITRGQKVGQSNLPGVLSGAVDFVPVIGDAKAFAEAETPWEYGLAGLGLVPGVGDVAATALKSVTPLFGKATRMSTKLKDPEKAKPYTDRLGLPNTKEGREAANQILQDAGNVARGVKEVGPLSKRAEWQEGYTKYNPKWDKMQTNNPFDLIGYELPSKEQWKKLYPNTPYPTKPANIAVDAKTNFPVSPFEKHHRAIKKDGKFGKRVDEALARSGPLAPEGGALAQMLAAGKARK